MKEQAIYKEHKLKDGHILQVFQDTWAESPRTWDNLGTMAIFHKRYNFGDEVDFLATDFPDWPEMEDYIKTDLKAVVILPIYMYDHSGITINTQEFSCPWDSGQVGFIYVTESDLKDCHGVSELTQEHIDKATTCLEEEVKTMDRYITGDVYGFQLIKKGAAEEEIDACSGFYGADIQTNGMLDYIPQDLIPENL